MTTNADLSEREPHRQILEYLKPEALDNPLTARAYIPWSNVMPGINEEQAKAALDELIEAGLVVAPAQSACS